MLFLDVTEDNGEASSLFAPMPGLGGPIATNNSLYLGPQRFSSKSISNSAHFIDSTLTTVIKSNSGLPLNEIRISQLGDYALGGLSGGESNAVLASSFFWTVLEVDNIPVSLATQATNLILGTGSGPNGGQYSRPGDDGAGVIWFGVANIDLAGYLASLPVSGEVTAVRLAFDHTLLTSADDVSTAFVKTKSINIDVDLGLGTLSDNLVDSNSGALSASSQVPEPGTALLLVASWCCSCRWRQAA